MSNYETIGMIVFGLGVIIVVAKPLLDLRSILTKLEVTLASIEKTIGEHEARNEKAHDELYDTVRDHENRILKIETKHSGNHTKEVK